MKTSPAARIPRPRSVRSRPPSLSRLGSPRPRRAPVVVAVPILRCRVGPASEVRPEAATDLAGPPSPPDRRRVLIMDPCPLVRFALGRLVDQSPGMSVAGYSASTRETLELQATLDPEVVTLEFPERDGASLDLVKDLLLRQPRLRILVVSSLPELVLGPRALRAGAHGFISKLQDIEEIGRALRTVASGRRHMSDALSAQLARLYLGGDAVSEQSIVDELSDRQLQVFRLIGQGHSIRNIAERMVLSIKTIETHVGHLKRKLGVDSGRGLVHQAVRWVDGAAPG